MTLKGIDAADFIEDAKQASLEDMQMIMAKLTGNFKKGNEKIASQKKKGIDSIRTIDEFDNFIHNRFKRKR
ncbi:MAG: hypothetical protein ABIA04_02445 [Pseudomonadota bacterium]